jgi:hypothetical protein
MFLSIKKLSPILYYPRSFLSYLKTYRGNPMPDSSSYILFLPMFASLSSRRMVLGLCYLRSLYSFDRFVKDPPNSGTALHRFNQSNTPYTTITGSDQLMKNSLKTISLLL